MWILHPWTLLNLCFCQSQNGFGWSAYLRYVGLCKWLTQSLFLNLQLVSKINDVLSSLEDFWNGFLWGQWLDLCCLLIKINCHPVNIPILSDDAQIISSWAYPKERRGMAISPSYLRIHHWSQLWTISQYNQQRTLGHSLMMIFFFDKLSNFRPKNRKIAIPHQRVLDNFDAKEFHIAIVRTRSPASGRLYSNTVTILHWERVHELATRMGKGPRDVTYVIWLRRLICFYHSIAQWFNLCWPKTENLQSFLLRMSLMLWIQFSEDFDETRTQILLLLDENGLLLKSLVSFNRWVWFS